MVVEFQNYADLHDGVTGDTIRAAAEDPRRNADVIAALASELDADEQHVAEDVEGDIEAGTRSDPQQAQQVASDLAFDGYYAVGLLTMFAGHVDTFDTEVEDLNQRLRTITAQRRRPFQNMPDEDVPEYSTTWYQVKAELRPEYQRADDLLEDGADEVAHQFDLGASPERMKELVADGFLPLAMAVQFPSITYTDAELADLRERLEREGRLEDFFIPPPLGTSSANIERLVELARRMDVEATVYADALQQMYVTRAAESAGIDLTTWDVTQGASGVAGHYEGTYEYYAQLYLDNPDFRWAAMASMIGPSFAAGFEDLEFFRDIADDLSNIPDYALPPALRGLDDLAQLGEEDIAFYEQTFLQMQKDIFYDASTMHEAYNDLGMDGIDELREAGLLGGDPQQVDQAYQSWEAIDTGIRTGDTDLLNEGNEGLLYREQHYTIADQYDDMRNRPVTGEAMTYVMGIVGQPSIPGTSTLGEVEGGYTVEVDTMPLVPGVQGGEVTVNLPQGNISDFDTRWGLIEDDTLPVFLDLVENDPDQVEDILSESVRDRIDENRLDERWPDILDSLVDGELRLW
ncbi:hypothetical protein ACHAAC_16630 [Aeromicrobium sp. CF4.19]|uniref:hypothetical protein n=1 Tax=Aeromicrobium sp. CF4.19 TaxID=3373082 RepID=UPI003EE7EB9B